MIRCNHHGQANYRNGVTIPARDCTCVATFDAIVAGETIPKLEAYCAIVREAARHPEFLTSFASDLLVHDRNELTDYTGPFLWVLKSNGCGTILAKPTGERGSLTVECIRDTSGDGGVWCWWDEDRLRVVTPDQAEDLHAMAVERTLRHARKSA